MKIKQITGLTAELAAKALDNAVLKKDSNLSDVASTSAARTNLGVYSTSQVNELVATASQSRDMATKAALESATDLVEGERIFVHDNGDGKWAIHLVVETTDGSYANSTVVKIADQDIFEHALTKEAVKSSYESNPDTNAFTDAEQTKVSRITISSVIDLDALQTLAEKAETDAANAQTSANNAQTAADAADTKATNAQTAADAADTKATNAQTAADTADSKAVSAQSAADTADSKAVAAQSAADTADSKAVAAQSTADTALSTAQSKKEIFRQIKQTFNHLESPANTDLEIILSNELADYFTHDVYVNGLHAESVMGSADNRLVINVPYSIEMEEDIIVVKYTTHEMD